LLIGILLLLMMAALLMAELLMPQLRILLYCLVAQIAVGQQLESLNVMGLSLSPAV
jgi:hypothetical protein